MNYELSNYPKNQDTSFHNPDGSGNPPDFFFGRLLHILLFSLEFSELCLQRTAGIAFPEKAQTLRSQNFFLKYRFI